MKQVRATSLLAVIALLVALLGSSGMAHAQEPRGGLQARTLQTATSCPPDVVFGCVLSGAGPHGWRVDNSATSSSALGVWGRVTASTPGASAAGVRGQVTSTTSVNGYGVWGSHDGRGAGVYGYSPNGYGVFGRSTNGTGFFGQSTNGRGVFGRSSANMGVVGQHQGNSTAPGVMGQTDSTSAEAAGVLGVVNTTTAGSDSAGVRGVNSDTRWYGYGVWGSHAGYGTGVYGYAPSGTGVRGASDSSIGVAGYSSSSYGVIGESSNSTGVYGSSTNSYGVIGESSNSTGVYGYAPSGIGVHGSSTNSSGVSGSSSSWDGVAGYSSSGFGVYGQSNSSTGVYGSSNSSYGVIGYSSSSIGVYGSSGTSYAGYFVGNVAVTGTLSKAGGAFKIDHPLDPANRTLSHSFVESPDMMNVYNGNITTDANGDATVVLPAYFEALNRDFRYQLTVIGQFAQAVVATEIQNNQFTIKADKPHVKVSWQVTGIRQDPWANENRIQVEEVKPQDEQGTYLYPQGYGQPESQGRDFQERAPFAEAGQPAELHTPPAQRERPTPPDLPSIPPHAPSTETAVPAELLAPSE